MGSVLKDDCNDDSLFSINLDAIQQTVTNIVRTVKYALQYYYRLNPKFMKLALLIYGISFLLVFPVICHNLPYSVYWIRWDNKDIIKEVTSSNHERFVAASNYIRSLKPFKAVPNPVLTISVITVKRTDGSRPLGYLTQVMGKLEQVTKSGYPFASTQLLICDVHAGPGPHTEADTLQNIFERKQRFRETNPSAVIMDSFEKEKQDYIFCLQQSLARNPKYVILLEDDALPRSDMLKVIHSSLSTLDEHHRQWSLLKLYYPERWQGYAFEITRIFELLSVGTLSGFAFLAVHHQCGKQPVSRMSKKLKCASFFMGFWYGILCCLAIGRLHLLELKRWSPYTYSLRPAPDCCSPGILYPADIVPKLIKLLNSTQCHHNYPLDMALASHTTHIGQSTYIIEPNVIRHIGLVSTIKGLSNAPWDFLL